MYIFKKTTIALLLATLAVAQAQTTALKLKGTRLTYPLFSRWIAEFNKAYPHVKVEIDHHAPADSIDLSIAAYKLGEEDLRDHKQGITLTRYAQILITNTANPQLSQLLKTGLREKDIKQLYFKSDKSSEATKAPQLVNLYRRETPACASVSFAKHYGGTFAELSGTGIKGDDKDLLKAVKKDPQGLSYNNLGFVYDLQTRKVVDSIAVIPIDLNDNGKIDSYENIYKDLDGLIAFIEKTRHKKIPVEAVNVIYSKKNAKPSLQLFLQWVLTEGQKYSHEYGFISQEPATLHEQLTLLTTNLKN